MDSTMTVNYKTELNFERMDLLKLPIEYEINISSIKEKVDITPTIQFDDYETYEPLENDDKELMHYNEMAMPFIFNYFTTGEDKLPKPGCEYEATTRRYNK